MRATLEQLKATSESELHSMWSRGDFPFDAAECGTCLTCHAQGICIQHVGLIPRQFMWNMGPKFIANLEELYALRLFYDSLYPQAVEAAEEKTLAESAPSLVAQG